MKKIASLEGGRLHRQESSVSLRKEKREMGLQKRRNLLAEDATAEADAEAGANAAGSMLPPDIDIRHLELYCAGVWT